MIRCFSLFSAAALSACVLGSLAGCSRATKTARGPQPVPVQTAAAQQRDVPITQTTIGSVQALRTVAVKSQVDGVIAEIHFREGDEVKSGDLLVTLDRRPFENSLRTAEADLANARAQLAQAQADAARYENLDQKSVVSKEELLQYRTKATSAEATVKAKEAALANAQLELSYTEIRAPISGRTGQLSLHEGALVKANDASQAIVTINQLQPISVAYAVPESLLPAIRNAFSAGVVKVTVSAHGAAGQPESIAGRLEFLDNSVDPTTGTITLKATMENADRKLWPGEFVDVTTFVGQDANAVLVPTAAVQVGQRGPQVFVVKPDKTVELRPVQTGRQYEENTIIREGIHPGDQVVTDGQLRLVPGAHVEIKPLNNASNQIATSATDGASAADPKS